MTLALFSLRRETGRRLSALLRIRFSRYLVAGLASWAADFAVFVVITKLFGLEATVTNCFSRPVGGLVCFFLNKYWTFDNRGAKSARAQFLTFWCVFAVSFALSELLIWGLYAAIGSGGEFAKYVAKLGAETIVLLFNFACLRYWTFR